jgi:hypothetical protein
MARWHRMYHQGIANEQAAKARAAKSGMGEYYIATDGEEYMAWPNGETHPVHEYTQWLAMQAINAQYGQHG